MARLPQCYCIKFDVLQIKCDGVLTKSLYREDFTFGPLNSHRYIGIIVISKIVISGFRPIHFTVTFAGTQNIHRYIRNIVISRSRIVISGFHCIKEFVF